MNSKDTIQRDFRRLMSSANPVIEISGLSTGVRELVECAESPADKAKVLKYFAMASYSEGNFVEAFDLFIAAHNSSGQAEALINALVCGRKAGDVPTLPKYEKKAIELAENLAESDEKAKIYDVLCHNAWKNGRHSSATKFGRESLRIKDALQSNGQPLIARERPRFSFEDRKRNIISFSLYGNQERYIRVALENAKAVQYVYPGWTCRFTVDRSVPSPVLDQLASVGAQVRISPNTHDPAKNTGLFWRFTVASDPEVDFFLVRDADSLINVREKVAVDEWVASDCDFHVMRDFYTHSELILAGLWGGVAGRIPDIVGQIAKWRENWADDQMGVHNHDQLFLRSAIWPSIKSSLMQHDSVFHGKGTHDFPKVGKLQPYRHVGQDMGIFIKP